MERGEKFFRKKVCFLQNEKFALNVKKEMCKSFSIFLGGEGGLKVAANCVFT